MYATPLASVPLIAVRSGGCPRRERRIGFAILATVAAIAYVWLDTVRRPGPRDFDQLWFAARSIVHHQNPYDLIGPGRAFDWSWLFYYPLTSAVFVLPLAWLPVVVARMVFVGLSAFLFALVLKPHQRPALLSQSFVVAITAAQWSPLLIAAALLPGLAWLLPAKPNVGAALLTAWPNPRQVGRFVVGGLVALIVSLIFVPHWPHDWLAALFAGRPSSILVLTLLGPILLLAALRWRLPEGRLLLALACIPQTVAAYDALPLMLIARTRVESLVLAACSYLAWAGQYWSAGSPRYDPAFVNTWYVLALYIPALVMVLRRPNRASLL